MDVSVSIKVRVKNKIKYTAKVTRTVSRRARPAKLFYFWKSCGWGVCNSMLLICILLTLDLSSWRRLWQPPIYFSLFLVSPSGASDSLCFISYPPLLLFRSDSTCLLTCSSFNSTIHSCPATAISLLPIFSPRGPTPRNPNAAYPRPTNFNTCIDGRAPLPTLRCFRRHVLRWNLLYVSSPSIPVQLTILEFSTSISERCIKLNWLWFRF
jgi:hypothetical protein